MSKHDAELTAGEKHGGRRSIVRAGSHIEGSAEVAALEAAQEVKQLLHQGQQDESVRAEMHQTQKERQIAALNRKLAKRQLTLKLQRAESLSAEEETKMTMQEQKEQQIASLNKKLHQRRCDNKFKLRMGTRRIALPPLRVNAMVEAASAKKLKATEALRTEDVVEVLGTEDAV